MTMITTNGLNHLALPVNDPERSAQFYAQLFNMEVISSSPDIAFLRTVDSQDLIALNRAEETAESSRNTLHFGFIVEPEQFDAALRTIDERSIRKVSEPGERDIGRYIFIEDLDNYVVEIFEDLSNRNP